MTILITGANRGLGYATALALAVDRSRTILLAGRGLPDLTRAAQRIQARTGNTRLKPMYVDLADLASVRAFAQELAGQRLPPLRVIVCNAGISKPTARERSVDGYELSFAANHLGHFLLVHPLLGHAQPPARIIFVSSAAHDGSRANGPLQPPRYVRAEWLAYPQRDPGAPTKDDIAGGLSTPELPITSNAFDPGLMAGTGLGRYSKGLMRLAWTIFLPLASRLFKFGRTTGQSGADLAYLASAPHLSSVSGRYFSGREQVASSPESYDPDKAADLWRASVELSGLQPGESTLAGTAT